jgi:KipI family sensor histidine kinase inhibitor
MTHAATSEFALHTAGSRALLVDLPDQNSVHQLTHWLLNSPGHEFIEEVVPGARTVLVIARRNVDDVSAVLSKYCPSEQRSSTANRHVDIPIVYDGPDLDEVCSTLGITQPAFVAAHAGADHTVAFFGFTPGFAYIAGVPVPLHIPRRTTPRTRIPAGSVAIANGYTVIYPGDTPGGWNLIGHTTCGAMWNISADPPNRLSLGDRLTFRVSDA